MHHSIRPLVPGAVIGGRSATVRVTALENDNEAPYETRIEALGSLRPDDVVVIDCGGSDGIAVGRVAFDGSHRARRSRRGYGWLVRRHCPDRGHALAGICPRQSLSAASILARGSLSSRVQGTPLK
jgi:hypothetical protein